MNPAQLLNPKAFAKTQEKAKKKAPNYGPTQARKPLPPSSAAAADGKPSIVKYDPRALLNPRTAASSSKAKDSAGGLSQNQGHAMTANEDTNGDGPGMSGMLERQFGVTARESHPIQKRKSASTTENDEEEIAMTTKKPKTTFSATDNNGILSDHMKAEREKIAATSEPSTEPIDLTAEDDEEIVLVGESKLDERNMQKVCLGRLSGSCLMFHIPRSKAVRNAATPKDFWPNMRTFWKRGASGSAVIELHDREPGKGHNTMFGKISSAMASALCPLIDGRHVSGLEMKVYLLQHKKQPGDREGGRVSRSVPLAVQLWSPRIKAMQIGQQLSKHQLFLGPPVNADGHRYEYFNPQLPPDFRPANVKQASKGLKSGSRPAYGVVSRTEEQMKQDTQTVLDSIFSTRDLPEMECKNQLIETPLLPHQKQALFFMTQHEREVQDADEEGSDQSLWQSRMTPKGETWYHIITNHEVAQKPTPMRGGILADVMGLGKTMSILALLATTLDEAEEFGKAEAVPDLEDIQENARSTLIICPKSVLPNWQEQVRIHTRGGRLRVAVYHGSNRSQDLDELASHNIVLTTYSTVAAEFTNASKARNALAQIQWFRIVLDEAHQIRTESTRAFQACHALQAQRRWAVTGTPVQNRLDDMGALVKFLKLKPFDEGSAWAQHITAGFKGANPETEKHLKLIVHGITLRRHKDDDNFTKKTSAVVRLSFNDSETMEYRVFASASRKSLASMINEKTGKLKGRAYGHVLKSLLRLRMYCAHGREMMSEDDLKELQGLTESTAIELGDEPDENQEPDASFITEQQAYESLSMLIDSINNQCESCGKPVGRSREEEAAEDSDNESEQESSSEEEDDLIGFMTPCYHLICPKCEDKHKEDTKKTLGVDHFHNCIYCDSYVRYGLLELYQSTYEEILAARRRRNKKDKIKWDNDINYSGPSTKVRALIDDLKRNAHETAQLPPSEDPIRSVVFSGWTTFLDLIEHALEEHGIGYTRLDGTMSLKARSRVIETFKSDPAVTVLLVSIKAGGQGLNFTAANKVYMMEPQFNPGVEDQAIDRVHRLGQKRDVEIKHYVMCDSVEEGIRKLQDKKRDIAAKTMEKKVEKGASGGDMIALVNSADGIGALGSGTTSRAGGSRGMVSRR